MLQNPLLSKTDRVAYTSKIAVECADSENSEAHSLNVQLTTNKSLAESIHLRLFSDNDLFFLRECSIDKMGT